MASTLPVLHIRVALVVAVALVVRVAGNDAGRDDDQAWVNCRVKLRDAVATADPSCSGHGDRTHEVWAYKCQQRPGGYNYLEHNENSRCVCDVAWTGVACEVDVKECAVHNGGCAHTCVETIGGPPTCTCNAGYTTSDDGKSCTEVADCYDTAPCLNGGVCYGLRPGPRCYCPAHWHGTRCEVDVKECAVHNGGCAHTCVETIGGRPTCTCNTGYTTSDGGKTCTEVADCYGTAPCLNGGVCHGLRPGPRCHCPTHWLGPRCEDDVKECAVRNGGCAHTCVETIGGPPTCKCREGYVTNDGGETCTEPADCYGTAPCKNGGVCYGLRPDPRCYCPVFWQGPRCEEDVKECAVRNGDCDHVCVEVRGGPPVCRCKDGYSSLRGGSVCVEPATRPDASAQKGDSGATVNVNNAATSVSMGGDKDATSVDSVVSVGLFAVVVFGVVVVGCCAVLGIVCCVKQHWRGWGIGYDGK